MNLTLLTVIYQIEKLKSLFVVFYGAYFFHDEYGITMGDIKKRIFSLNWS